ELGWPFVGVRRRGGGGSHVTWHAGVALFGVCLCSPWFLDVTWQSFGVVRHRYSGVKWFCDGVRGRGCLQLMRRLCGEVRLLGCCETAVASERGVLVM